MNGILLIDKPSGWTSNDVVQKLRGILRERRIGHAGTLDPMATGLLTVFVGRATRAVAFAEGMNKRYLAGFRPGVTTDTQDITGNFLRKEEVQLTEKEMHAVCAAFTGEIQQIPPMYSAVKVNGQRLYRLARRGEEVERTARKIVIENLEPVGRDGEDWILDVTCSKGTYVRTLCHDMGEKLGCGACMSSLRRMAAGRFSVEDAYTLTDVQQAADNERAEELLLPIDSLFQAYPALTVTGAAEKKIRNGQGFLSDKADPGPVRLYSQNGEFLALGNAENGSVSIIKSFFEV
jgi:tRNA pseudouridine55 synthase